MLFEKPTHHEEEFQQAQLGPCGSNEVENVAPGSVPSELSRVGMLVAKLYPVSVDASGPNLELAKDVFSVRYERPVFEDGNLNLADLPVYDDQ